MGGSACFWALGVVRLYAEEADKLYYPLIKCHKAFNQGIVSDIIQKIIESRIGLCRGQGGIAGFCQIIHTYPANVCPSPCSSFHIYLFVDGDNISAIQPLDKGM